MSQMEVEHRGLLTAEKFEHLNSFLSKEGTFLGKKKRFSMIKSASIKSIREVKDDPVDLKIRITNGQAELACKYGKWSGKDARKEYNFEFETKKFTDFIEFLKILGFTKYVLMANTKYDYEYRGVEFAVVEVPDWGHYFEAEILTDEENVADANKILDKEIDALGLKVLGEEEFYDLLDELNSRPGYRIDLEKDKLSDILEKFKEYIEV
ncbi:MAG: CYTH domain-containing protein [Patescibacteria group bacterium]